MRTLRFLIKYPDLQIRGGGSDKGGGHPDPEIRGGGPVNFFWPSGLILVQN